MTLDIVIKLLVENEVPDHIILHSYKVAKVVWVLTHELNLINYKVNKELCLYAALLHDITKFQSIINKGEDHSKTGGILLRKLGYDDIAEIIESHVILKNMNYLGKEKEIVFYADKRVKHDKIVSLEDRFEDLKIRYGINEKVMDGYKKAKEIELKFEKLGIKTKYFVYLN